MKPGDNLNLKATIWAVVTAISFVVAFSGNFLPDRLTYIALIGLTVFLPSMFIASYHLKRAGLDSRRRAAKEAAPPESPPVLYLRSFEDDVTAATFKGDLTEEENLVRALTHIGPVVAIGRPGEELPLAGASRIYVADERWQEQVKELMGRARLVVIRTGETPGLLWELRTALQLCEPSRLLLAGDHPREIARLIGEIQAVHPSGSFAMPRRAKKAGSLLGFVRFDARWQPTFLPVRRAATYLFARQQHNSLMSAVFVHTLQPVFAQLGVPFPSPQRDILKIGYILFCIAFLGWALMFGGDA